MNVATECDQFREREKVLEGRQGSLDVAWGQRPFIYHEYTYLI